MKSAASIKAIDLSDDKTKKILDGIPPGTLVFTRNKLGLNSSSAIQAAQRSKWSHVFMCLDNGEIIETNKDEGAKIKSLTKALEGVCEAEFLIPIKPIADEKKLRTLATSITSAPGSRAEYGLSTMTAAGFLPFAKSWCWGFTGGLAVLTLFGLASAPPLSLATMAFASKILSKLDSSFGSQEQIIAKMEKLYKGLNLTGTGIGEKLSDEDHKLICSTLVQKMLECSNDELKEVLEKKGAFARPKELKSAADDSEDYKSHPVKFS
jgi:hypothetical protein